jgi:hypothetical protein
VKTISATPKTNPKFTRYLFASTMGVMRTLTHVTPPAEIDVAQEAYDATFAKACHFLEGMTLWRKWWPPSSGHWGRIDRR